MVNWQDSPSTLTPLTAANLVAAFAEKVNVTSVGAVSGVASLDGAGDVPLAQIPSLASLYAPPSLTGTYAARPAATTVPAGTIYYATDVPEQYRSNGTAWSVVGSGGSELGYAQIVTQFATASTTAVDVTGLSYTCIVGERPVKIIFDGTLRNTTVAVYARALIVVDGTASGNAGGPTATAGEYRGGHREVTVRGLTPGSSHTFKIQACAPTGGTTSVEGSAADPAFIQIVTL